MLLNKLAINRSELSSGLFWRPDNPEVSSEPHTRRRENLKSHIAINC
jgi:hypothetical protein